jgi:hypothetical protein
MGDPTVSAAAFAEQLLLRPRWPHQVPAVDSDAFIVAIAGDRRSGKTLAAQVKARRREAPTRRGAKRSTSEERA